MIGKTGWVEINLTGQYIYLWKGYRYRFFTCVFLNGLYRYRFFTIGLYESMTYKKASGKECYTHLL